MRATMLTAWLLAIITAACASCVSTPVQAQAYVSGTIKTVRTGWNAESFAVVLNGPGQNPARCPNVDGYLSEAAQPGYETYLDAVLAAYRAGSTITLAIDSSGCVQGRPKLIGIDQMPPAEPERRTVVLRVSRWNENISTRSFDDVPVTGTFTGHGTDCSRGGAFHPSTSPGSGPDVFGEAGWGQIEGDGHPGSNSDSCVSWVRRFAFDFDLQPFTSVEGDKQLERVVLRYVETETPIVTCYALAYTQGGFFVDPLTCWTSGNGNHEDKPQGCLFLRVPSVDWGTLPDNRPKPLLNMSFPKLGPRGAWDVTALFRRRVMPGFEPPPELGGSAPLGWGFALVGAYADTSQLDAEDNTRCTSHVADIALEVTFTVLPAPPPGEPLIVR